MAYKGITRNRDVIVRDKVKQGINSKDNWPPARNLLPVATAPAYATAYNNSIT